MIGKSKRLMTYREKPSWTENGFKHHNRRSSPLSTRVECPAGLVGKCGKLTVTGAGYRILYPVSGNECITFVMKLGGTANRAPIRPKQGTSRLFFIYRRLLNAGY